MCIIGSVSAIGIILPLGSAFTFTLTGYTSTAFITTTVTNTFTSINSPNTANFSNWGMALMISGLVFGMFNIIPYMFGARGNILVVTTLFALLLSSLIGALSHSVPFVMVIPFSALLAIYLIKTRGGGTVAV